MFIQSRHRCLLQAVGLLLSVGNLTAQVVDREGYSYKTVQIGKQEWLAENLNTSHFRNGDPIPEVEGAAEWQAAGNQGKPAWCYYNGDTASGNKYHKLYNWYALIDPRGLAPDGWHIPTITDWAALTGELGGENGAAIRMKSHDDWDGNNTSGFTALPGGYRNFNNDFSHIRNIASWWSASAVDSTNAWTISIGNGGGVSGSYDGKRVGLSVRFVRTHP
jgi:uncharacterized protein (TIGR02145 family)